MRRPKRGRETIGGFYPLVETWACGRETIGGFCFCFRLFTRNLTLCGQAETISDLLVSKLFVSFKLFLSV